MCIWHTGQDDAVNALVYRAWLAFFDVGYNAIDAKIQHDIISPAISL